MGPDSKAMDNEGYLASVLRTPTGKILTSADFHLGKDI